jgi:FtsP/CotA-like multicopper oxidase with cupredoxin domain
MRRREFLSYAGGAAAAGGAGVVGAGGAQLLTIGESLLAPEHLSAKTAKADHTLHIAPVSFDLAPGQTIKTTGYNGMVPGPLLRMKEGRPVTIDLFNDTDMPEFLHWHGLFSATSVDGAEEEGSPAIPPNGHRRIILTPTPSGTRWYHTHSMAMTDMTRGAYNGQYGFLYVEPKSDPGNYDQEVFLAAHHWEPFIIHRPAPNNDWNVDYKSGSINGYVNGKALGWGEPIRVKQGQRVLFRLVNADATRTLNLALPGHRFRVIAMDGNPVPTPREVETLTLGVAERIDAVVEMNQPGVWVMGAPRDQERMMGMRVVIEYEGAMGEPKWVAPPNAGPWDYSIFGKDGTHREPDGKFEVAFKMLEDEGKAFNRWTINGQFWPNVEPLKVKAGKRYRIAFRNGMEDGHPVHIHRHSFEIISINGKPTSGLIKDTFQVPRDGLAEADFVADNPGLSLLHCHMQQHMDYGFKTLVKYA